MKHFFTNISVRPPSNTILIEPQLKQIPLSMDSRAVLRYEQHKAPKLNHFRLALLLGKFLLYGCKSSAMVAERHKAPKHSLFCQRWEVVLTRSLLKVVIYYHLEWTDKPLLTLSVKVQS